MQVCKFSSFTVYCRKRENFHKLKISKTSWFSILLSLHLLFLILFFLSLLFSLFFFWSFVFYRQVLQLLGNRVRTLGVVCGQKERMVSFSVFPWSLCQHIFLNLHSLVKAVRLKVVHEQFSGQMLLTRSFYIFLLHLSLMLQNMTTTSYCL